MNKDFARAMRLSLEQTRAGNPAEATRLIRQALTGGQGAAGDAGGMGDQGRAPPRDITPPEMLLAPPQPPQPRRKRRPLGEVIAGLAQRPAGLAANLSAPAVHPPRHARAPDVPGGALMEQRRFAGPSGARDYRLYLPATHRQGLSGVVVMLHGCTQSPEDFAAGTAMNAQADRHGFAVIWPEQTRGQNASLCWNWFRAGDQGRGGEPAILQGMAADIATAYGAPQVFAAGLSAGGAMAAILGHAYPETFAAVGVHSGLAPRSAQDVMGAFASMRGDAAPGAVAVATPVIVFHGTQDRTVAPANAARVTGPLTQVRTRAGQSAGRRYSVTEGRTGAGHRAEVWTVEGAGHAWAGGQPEGSFTDPAGPDATAAMVRFFLAGRGDS